MPLLRSCAKLVVAADIVFTGEDEAALLVDAEPAERMAISLSRLGPREVIIKRGGDGAVAWLDGTTLSSPAHPVPLVDPVGAGDAFVAGYLAELLAGAPAPQRLATATAAGAFAVSVLGGLGRPSPTR